MIQSILVDAQAEALFSLESQINESGLNLMVTGRAQTAAQALQLISKAKPDLVFIGINRPNQNCLGLLQKLSSANYETIIVTEKDSMIVQVLRYGIAGCIQKPVEREELAFAVQNARKRIRLREETRCNEKLVQGALDSISGNQLVGVPTMKGLDFFHIEDIIRCEGLQSYTHIVTQKRSNIVSSYHLAEFRKLFRPYSFFSPHRSHLINLHHVQSYNREGTITMDDGSHVPVARRRKSKFLKLMIHI